MSNPELRLEEEVNKLGVTQVASLLGVARNTIYNWIAKGNVPLDKLLALQDAGLDVTYIITGVRARASETQPLSRDEECLLDNYRHTSENGKAAMQATGAALAQSNLVKKAG